MDQGWVHLEASALESAVPSALQGSAEICSDLKGWNQLLYELIGICGYRAYVVTMTARLHILGQ